MSDSKNANDGVDGPAAAASLPQILTRSVLPSLIRDLDASDVLECYSLTRTAPLHHFVDVQKMALGIRYEPPEYSHKQPLELTLEYGPQRTGDWLEQESMPLLLQENHYLSWENEGKVYYTTASIHNSISIQSAYYMASMTGAVLQKILEKAVGYAANKPRYQPFQVVHSSAPSDDRATTSSSSESNGGGADSSSDTQQQAPDPHHQLVLKSSSSIDFIYQMWLDMAELGVDLRPVLEPPLYIPRLHVMADSVHKVSGYTTDGKLVTAEAAHFYSKLSNCWTAVANGDYSVYDENEDTDVPAETPNDEEEEDQSPDPTGAPSEGIRATDPPSTSSEEVSTPPSSSDDDNNRQRLLRRKDPWYDNNRLVTEEEKNVPSLSPSSSNNDKDDADDVFITELHNLDIDPSSNSSNDFVTFSPSLAPTSRTDSQAQEAAEEAAQAAQEAKNASSTKDAIDASEHAADAAQKAANIARWQKDVQKLHSVDGTLVTQALSQCWTDPMFQIASENNSQVEAYLYLDGNFYYRLNLTAPYLSVVELQWSIPLPPSQSSVSYDDFVDWSLAFVIIGLLAIGIFALIQQMGIKILFFRLQKWFFSPTHYSYDSSWGSTHNSSDPNQGQGRLHGFAEDAIPMSMGGRKPVPRPSALLVTHSPGSAKRTRTLAAGGAVSGSCGDIELVQPTTPTGQKATMGEINQTSLYHQRTRSSFSFGANGGSEDSLSVGSDEDSDQEVGRGEFPPARFARNPDLVDMPNLTSFSKTATPYSESSDGASPRMKKSH